MKLFERENGGKRYEFEKLTFDKSLLDLGSMSADWAYNYISIDYNDKEWLESLSGLGKASKISFMVNIDCDAIRIYLLIHFEVDEMDEGYIYTDTLGLEVEFEKDEKDEFLSNVFRTFFFRFFAQEKKGKAIAR